MDAYRKTVPTAWEFHGRCAHVTVTADGAVTAWTNRDGRVIYESPAFRFTLPDDTEDARNGDL